MNVTSLAVSYCKPITEKDKTVIFDDLCSCLVDRGKYEGCAVYMPDMFYSKNLKDRTEVSVEKFADMINDKITGWRLEELDFEFREASDVWALRIENIVDGWVQDFYIKFRDGKVQIGGNITTVATFSDLQQLIKFLTII